MMSPVTNRQFLLNLAQTTLETLESEPSNLERISEVRPDAVKNSLEQALDWAQREEPAAAEESVAPSSAEPYIPYNQALSLLQSAYDEYVESRGITEMPFDPLDPGWQTIAQEKLKAASRPKHPFTAHSTLDSFRYELPADSVVALFSDWGTGEATAQRVMQQIAAAHPTHALHLGDVYYAGTPKEAQERFLDIIERFGPPKDACRYLSLPGNHDYYSGGYAYFDSILPALNQEASYFNLRNGSWQIIGLDTGYQEYGLQDPQLEWLMAQLEGSSRKSILLSHHQLFSAYDSRVSKSTILNKVEALLRQVYAWFWGHEHRCVIMDKHLGIRARCIGHGAIPSKVPYGHPVFPDIPVLKVDERAAPNAEGTCYHGFAVLKFHGDSIDVSYIDEYGEVFFKERFE